MPLNLLKHKSYHVNKEENIARVRRDEQAAAESEKQKVNNHKAFRRASKMETLRANRGIHKTSPVTQSKKYSTTSHTEETTMALFNKNGSSQSLRSAKNSSFLKGTNSIDTKQGDRLQAQYPNSSVVSLLHKPKSETKLAEKKRRNLSDAKRLDELVKRDLDPLNIMKRGVEKTEQIEKREKRQREYSTGNDRKH